MEEDSKTKGIVQTPTININARKIQVPPRIIRFLGLKSAKEFIAVFPLAGNQAILVCRSRQHHRRRHPVAQHHFHEPWFNSPSV